jgi:hypothetical protein
VPGPFPDGNLRTSRGAPDDRPEILQAELQQARLDRLDAQAAGVEVEELTRQVAHFTPGRGRMLFMVDCGEPEQSGPAH